MSSISAGLFKADTATIASNAGAITSTATTINTETTGAITTIGTTNIYDSSGTIAYINSSLTALQASVIPPVLPYYVTGPSSASDFTEAAKSAWQFSYPFLYSYGTIAALNASYGSIPGVVGINQFEIIPLSYFQLAISNFTIQRVTTSNVDTAYVQAMFDLTNGPITMNVPDSSNLYYMSIEFLDARYDLACVLSNRTSGSRARTYKIVGPNQLGSGPDIIRIPSTIGWLFVRVSYVNDPGLVKATAFLNSLIAGTFFPTRYTLTQALTGFDTSALNKPSSFNQANWAKTFTAAQKILSDSRTSPYFNDIAMLNKMNTLKIGPGFPSVWDSSSQNVNAAAIQTGIEQATNAISDFNIPASSTNWKLIPDEAYLTYITQNYNLQDYLAVNLVGGLPEYETKYYFLSGNGTNGIYSNWSSAYFNFVPPSDFVAANGSFWSATVYQYNDSSSSYSLQYSLTPNSYYDPSGVSWASGYGRSAIGNFTDSSASAFPQSRSLFMPIKDVSGNLPIYLSQSPPYDLSGNSLYNNWIPLPAQKFIDSSYSNVSYQPKTLNWTMVIRFYYPPPTVTSGSYNPPAIQDNSGNTIFKLTSGV